MKIEINIEKKHFYFFAVFLLLIGTLTVIAVDNPNVFHEVLYTDIIKSHSTEGNQAYKIKLITPEPDDTTSVDTYARLDFATDVNNGENEFWSMIFKDNKRLSFAYYDSGSGGWGGGGDIAWFKPDGSFNLREGNICDGSTEVCYEISDLADVGSQKLCSVWVTGSWRDTINVPESWTITDCMEYKEAIEGDHYALGCITENTVIFGEVISGGPPNLDCNWGEGLSFNDDESLNVEINNINYAMERGEEEANRYCIEHDFTRALFWDMNSLTSSNHDRADWNAGESKWEIVSGHTHMKYIMCVRD